MSAVILNPVCSFEVLLGCSEINAVVGLCVLTIIIGFVKWVIGFHDYDHLPVFLHVEVKTKLLKPQTVQ